MKTIDLAVQEISLHELLQWAEGKPVRILSPNGHSFILEETDEEFEREVALLGQSDAFRSFLGERAQEPGGMTLDEFEQDLSEAETLEIESTADKYTEKFKNRYGKEWIFEYSYITETAIVKGSDVDWQAYEVLNGQAVDLILNEEGLQWLRKAWISATAQSQPQH